MKNLYNNIYQSSVSNLEYLLSKETCKTYYSHKEQKFVIRFLFNPIPSHYNHRLAVYKDKTTLTIGFRKKAAIWNIRQKGWILPPSITTTITSQQYQQFLPKEIFKTVFTTEAFLAVFFRTEKHKIKI